MLDLERALETAQATAVDSETRIEKARREADAMLAAARERAERRAAQRKRSLNAAAEAEVQAVTGDAEAAAADLHEKADAVEASFVDAALAILLPSVAQEATCSRQ